MLCCAENGLAGTILFHVKDDTPVNESTSLTRAMYEAQLNHMRRARPLKILSKRSPSEAFGGAAPFRVSSSRRTLRYRIDQKGQTGANRMWRPSGRHAPLAQTLTFYVPDASYPPSGALDRQSGAIVRNDELDAKLALVNVVSYIGLAAQEKQSKTYESAGGTLYFQSPEVELLPPEMDPFCAPYNPICWCSRRFVQRSYSLCRQIYVHFFKSN